MAAVEYITKEISFYRTFLFSCPYFEDFVMLLKQHTPSSPHSSQSDLKKCDGSSHSLT